MKLCVALYGLSKHFKALIMRAYSRPYKHRQPLDKALALVKPCSPTRPSKAAPGPALPMVEPTSKFTTPYKDVEETLGKALQNLTKGRHEDSIGL